MSSQVSEQAFIGAGVQLGSRVSIGPGAVILGPCIIEDDVWIGPGAQIGAPPEMTSSTQNAAWTGAIEHSGVHVKAGAIIRELAVIHQGTYRATTIGERCWILNRAYVAHDVLIDSDTTLSAGVSIGGHALIGRNVNIGMNASVHQRATIAGGCMVGMATPVARDLPPFTKAFGSPARVRGLNRVGASRLGISAEDIAALEAAYRSGNVGLESLEPVQSDILRVIVAAWNAVDGKRPAEFAEHLS